MKKHPEKGSSPDRTAAVVSTVFLTLMAAGLMTVCFLSSYQPLYLCALIIALPALVQLTLLLPVKRKLPEPAQVEEDPQEDAKKRHHPFAGLGGKMAARYNKGRNGIVTALVVIAIVALHLLFWKLPVKPGAEKLGYYIPVLLAALFVVCIVLEKWCKYAIGENRYNRAVLRSLQSALEMSRIAIVLTVAALMLKLLDFYNADKILNILLSVLFVYETVFIAFSLAVRVIRHELSTAPEFLISVTGLGKSDMSILHYLESNTGITMRSLWSMQLVKKLIPAAFMGIALVLWLSTAIVQIESYQEGVLYRLGQLQPETLKPGIHLTLPWPFDSVEVYDTQSLNRVTVGYIPTGDQDNTWTEEHGAEEYRLLLGGGNELISINLQIEYRIADLASYVRNTANAESLLEAAGYEIVTARTISSDLDTMLSADREVFSDSFKDELAQKLSVYDTGLEVVNVVLESIHPPVEVANIFQALISTGIDAEHMILVAENNAANTISDALNQKEVTVGDAKVQYFTQIAAAESSVAEFMASVDAYDTYPDAYTYYKYMNAMTTAYSGSTLVIVSDGIDTNNLYLGNIGVPEVTEPQENDFESDEMYDDMYTFDEEY